MNFDWRNIDLKNASIFDLTDDIELIRECIDDEEFVMEDKDEYLKEGRLHWIPCDMCVFAEITNNMELQNKIEFLFAKEFEEVESQFNE